MKKIALLVLCLVVSGCGLSRKGKSVSKGDTLNILSLDDHEMHLGDSPMGSIPEPSKLAPTSSGGGGGSATFSFSGKTSSFTYTSRASALSSSGRFQSFKLGNASSSFKANITVPRDTTTSGLGGSGNCDWESSLRNFFTRMMDATLEKSGVTASAEMKAKSDAQLEAVLGSMRPYFAEADPQAVCLIADFYQCVADGFQEIATLSGAVTTCVSNMCQAAGGACAAMSAPAEE